MFFIFLPQCIDYISDRLIIYYTIINILVFRQIINIWEQVFVGLCIEVLCTVTIIFITDITLFYSPVLYIFHERFVGVFLSSSCKAYCNCINAPRKKPCRSNSIVYLKRSMLIRGQRHNNTNLGIWNRSSLPMDTEKPVFHRCKFSTITPPHNKVSMHVRRDSEYW